jgi:hypothetical protein
MVGSNVGATWQRQLLHHLAAMRDRADSRCMDAKCGIFRSANTARLSGQFLARNAQAEFERLFARAPQISRVLAAQLGYVENL